MSQLNRILSLYNRLKNGTYTIDQISELTDFQEVSKRQIYRDLIEVGKIAEANDERFIIITEERFNRKTYKVQPNIEHQALPADDLDTYYISRAVLPNVFTKQRATSLDRMQEVVRQRIISTHAIKYKTGLSEAITNSHFYENRVTSELDIKLQEVLWVIGQQLSICISHLSGDSTSVTPLVKLPIVVCPIKIIFHRGCFYVATIWPDNLLVLVFQIDHLTFQKGQRFRRTKKWVELIERDLNGRFGVSQNYNQELYDIRLRFSETTGKFVGEQYWHHTQNTAEIIGPNGEKNYDITFHCGINRELVGWIFQWMSNVKVLEPPQLVTLYHQQVAMIQNTVDESINNTLTYSNIFAPKA